MNRNFTKITALSIFAFMGNCLADDAFIRAAREGNISSIKRSLKNGVLMNERSTKAPNCTALHHAARKKHSKIVTKLIDAGADVNVTDGLGRTPLMYAVMARENLEIITKLVEAGADVNALSKQQETTLLFAVWHNSDLATIRYLLKAGADVNKQNKEQNQAGAEMTPLHKAVIDGQRFVVQTLLMAGAEPNVRVGQKIFNHTASGDTPLHLVLNPMMAWMLIYFGADPNLKNNDNQTPLERVIQNQGMYVLGNNRRVIQILILCGAEIPEHLNADPLVTAALKGARGLIGKIA